MRANDGMVRAPGPAVPVPPLSAARRGRTVHGMRLRMTAALVSLLALSSCLQHESTAPEARAVQTTLFIRANLSGTPVATVVVRVTAPDIATPLTFNIPTINGVAAGTITVLAGSNRTIALRAYDAGGVETDSGSVTFNIQPGMNPTISIVLMPLTGEPPDTVTLSSLSVTVQPAAATLMPGDTTRLTATVLDANGNVVTGRVTWATLNPAVATAVSTGQQTGRVSTMGPGRTTVVATYGGIAGPAVITVTDPPWPNEPTGFTVLTDWAENSVTGGGWEVAYASDSSVEIAPDATAPLSLPNVLQFSYPVGFQAGASPGIIYYDGIASKEVYSGFWWKPSDPWQDDPASNKIAFWFAVGGNGDMFIMMNGVGAPRRLVVTTEFPNDNRNLSPNINNPDVTLGRWHRIEWYAKYGSGATGIIKFWMDGLLVGEYSDVTFPNVDFVEFQVSPTFGGIGSIKTEHDYFWYDHVHISKP